MICLSRSLNPKILNCFTLNTDGQKDLRRSASWDILETGIETREETETRGEVKKGKRGDAIGWNIIWTAAVAKQQEYLVSVCLTWSCQGGDKERHRRTVTSSLSLSLTQTVGQNPFSTFPPELFSPLGSNHQKATNALRHRLRISHYVCQTPSIKTYLWYKTNVLYQR